MERHITGKTHVLLPGPTFCDCIAEVAYSTVWSTRSNVDFAFAGNFSFFPGRSARIGYALRLHAAYDTGSVGRLVCTSWMVCFASAMVEELLVFARSLGPAHIYVFLLLLVSQSTALSGGM